MKVKLTVIINDEYLAGHYSMYIGTKSRGLRYASDCIEGLAECFVSHIKYDTKFKKLFKGDLQEEIKKLKERAGQLEEEKCNGKRNYIEHS